MTEMFRIVQKADYQGTSGQEVQFGATLHYTTLHYTTLHYTKLHYTTLNETIKPKHYDNTDIFTTDLVGFLFFFIFGTKGEHKSCR